MQSKFFSLRFISCLLLVILLVGCATPAKRMARISLGMSKEQVIQNLGKPTVARGAIRNKFDQTVEVLEYPSLCRKTLVPTLPLQQQLLK